MQRASTRSPQALIAAIDHVTGVGDFDTYLSLHEPEAALVRRDGHLAIGYDAIREAIELPRPETAPATSPGVRVVQADGIALIVISDSPDVVVTRGDTAHRATEPTIMVARRQPDHSWRIIINDLGGNPSGMEHQLLPD